ncbi:YkgJ family cysteine cluster protein [bacterium]|nr:YkgJ family cysteine cluster protein [bacterium]
MLNFTKNELINYLKYIDFIQEKLDRYFEDQKPFIFCKKGCGRCCKNQQFPYSQIEMQYLIIGASMLPPEKRKVIEKKIDEIIEAKKKNKKKKFHYDCPFLIDNVCSVYNHRGLICRSFGLMIKPDKGSISVPFCFSEKLNYSNVINIRKKELSTRKYKKLNTTATPNAYHVGYKDLADEDLANGFGFRFGEIKQMVDWFEIFKEKLTEQIEKSDNEIESF